ncbi:MAG: MFS transporter, partial [Janthinobacterium sp.]
MGGAGLCGAAGACLALALLPASLGIPGYVAPIMLLTASYALFQAANNTAVMGDIAADQRGLISGMLNLSRNLGLVTGASVMGAVFAAGAGDIASAGAQPAAMIHGMHTTFAVASALILAALAIFALGRVLAKPPTSSGDPA